MIHISVRFALLLKDGFSGATVADGGQRFLINGRPARPLRKPDGFFVFTAPPGPGPDPEQRWDVWIESTRYFPGMPLRLVTLYRRPHSGFADCAWFEAKGPPGKLAAALWDADPPLALKGVSADGRAVYLRGYTAVNLIWRRVCIGDGPGAALFTLTARRPDGGYELDPAPTASWPDGTPVYLADCAPDLAAGRYSIPIRAPRPGRQPQLRYYDEEAMRWQET